MISLNTIGDYLLVVAVAAGSGLVGGLAAELLLNRDGGTGAFELPRRTKGLFDLGGFATLLVGVVAGVAILLVFPPQLTVVNSAADGTSTSTASYDLLRLIATSLVAGSAGGSVLSALQARVTAAINDARVEFVRSRGEDEIDHVRDVAKRQLETVRRTAAPTARARGIAGEPGSLAAVDELFAAAAAEIDQTADQARRAVTGVARPEER